MRLAVGLIAVALFAQDPVETLESARDKILSTVPSQPKYRCVETIEISRFSRTGTFLSPRPSCELLSADRKKGRRKLRLNATDRLRVDVSVADGREIYSWTGPNSFSQSVEEILSGEPIGTGAFASHLLDILSNPSVQFRLPGEKEETLEYGFRVPLEASTWIVRANSEWRPASYEGSIVFDRSSLDIRSLTTVSGELPAATSLCEVNVANEYPDEKTFGLTLPDRSTSYYILRDTTEAKSVTTFSNCRVQTTPPQRESDPEELELPAGISFELALTSAIDTGIAAAGDSISARLTASILQPKSVTVLVPAGAITTGRIVRMEHRILPRESLVVSLAFDKLQMGDGRTFRLRAESDGNAVGPNNWPRGTFIFPARDRPYVVPAGFISKWRPIAATSTK